MTFLDRTLGVSCSYTSNLNMRSLCLYHSEIGDINIIALGIVPGYIPDKRLQAARCQYHTDESEN